MPYIKRESPHEKSRRLLKGYDINASRLSKILDCSPTTAKTRIDNPGRLTGDEWLTISRRAHIPLDEIRTVILS